MIACSKQYVGPGMSMGPETSQHHQLCEGYVNWQTMGNQKALDLRVSTARMQQLGRSEAGDAALRSYRADLLSPQRQEWQRAAQFDRFPPNSRVSLANHPWFEAFLIRAHGSTQLHRKFPFPNARNTRFSVSGLSRKVFLAVFLPQEDLVSQG